MNSFWEQPSRPLTALIALVIGVFAIVMMTLLFSRDKFLGMLLLDYESRIFPYPLTIQNLMTLHLALGFGEIFVRWRHSVRESKFLGMHFLPEDERSVLQAKDLAPITRRVRKYADDTTAYLPNMTQHVIVQFFSSKSIEMAGTMLKSMSELYAEQIDTAYATLRYIAWSIPTLGFIGTVIGIASALSEMSPDNLPVLTSYLGTAFYTTLLALIYSAVLTFLMITVQAREERVLNRATRYCLLNLVNRLYV